jgi:hypothetical protein
MPALVVLVAALAPARGLSQGAPSPAAPAARLFAVVFKTGPAWDKSLPPPQQKNFKEHSQNIARLRSEGRLKVGGRFGEYGLLLIEAQDEAEVLSQIDRDASVAAGTFSAEVHAWSTFAPGCVERAPAPPSPPAAP